MRQSVALLALVIGRIRTVLDEPACDSVANRPATVHCNRFAIGRSHEASRL